MVCICRHQKHDYANYDRFVPNLGMAYKTIKRVSVPNLKLFGPTKTELRAKKLENFLLCYMGKLAGGVLYGCRNINVWRLKKFLTAVTFAFIGV